MKDKRNFGENYIALDRGYFWTYWMSLVVPSIPPNSLDMPTRSIPPLLFSGTCARQCPGLVQLGYWLLIIGLKPSEGFDR